MWITQWLVDFLGSAGAARNAAAVLDTQRRAMAEVDSAVARLQPHIAAQRPAA